MKRTILVSAYGCEPGKGSEQGVGWNWVLQLAKVATVVVVTRSNNREAIAASLPVSMEGQIHFIYYDLPSIFRRLKRKERSLYLYYALWQWGAYKCAKREISQRAIDYVMHLTFGSIWLPTFMHRLPVPFIWGPVGGGEAVPWKLIGMLPLQSRLVQYARYALLACLGFNPLFMGPARKAKIILARTADTARSIPQRFSAKTRTMLETAASEEWFGELQSHCGERFTSPVLAIYTGRLVPFKNLQMALRALAVARGRGANIEFLIVGDGPLEHSLSRQAVQEGIADAVTFLGRRTQREVLELLSKSDLYLFPSLREGGVWSLMEALAVGLPAICVRTSGMAVIADPGCARFIEIARAEEMVEAFAEALCELAADPEKRRKMGAAARARMMREFRWEQKASFMASVLDDIESSRV